MNNKKTKILITILIILIFGLTAYIVYDKIINPASNNQQQDDLSTGNKEHEQNSSKDGTQENIETEGEDLNLPPLGGRYSEEYCKQNYKEYEISHPIYKIKVTNPSGAKIYDSYHKSEQKVLKTIEYGQVLLVRGESVDTKSFQKDEYNYFEEIKEYHYFRVDLCDNLNEPEYFIKYSDVKVLKDSIIIQKYNKKQKYYIGEPEYLYTGPGLSFSSKDDIIKISEGVIVEVDEYVKIEGPGATWLHVNYNGKSGWLLEQTSHSENYLYWDIKWGNAYHIIEESGTLSLDKTTELCQYPWRNEKQDILNTIPNGKTISYDSYISTPGIAYYHVNYNGKTGWIVVSDWDYDGAL